MHMYVCMCSDTWLLIYPQHITDPHITNASLDVTINNPLSLAEDVS